LYVVARRGGLKGFIYKMEFEISVVRKAKQMIARVNKQMCEEYEEVVKSYKRGKEMTIDKTTHSCLFTILKKMIADHWKSEVSGKRGGKISGLNFNVNGTPLRNPNLVCHSCGKKGHLSKDCWAKHGKPPGKHYVKKDWKADRQSLDAGSVMTKVTERKTVPRRQQTKTTAAVAETVEAVLEESMDYLSTLCYVKRSNW